LLTLTLPTRTVTNEALTEPPAVEIFRGTVKPDGKPDKQIVPACLHIPGALLDTYTSEKHIQFKDPIAPEEIQARPGALLPTGAYARGEKRGLADSRRFSESISRAGTDHGGRCESDVRRD